ncbi:hypothetical protein M427DRAFT_310636 [Gonapodya prolifera JEL478]|uniref:Uncharacterized protein n=1 Tax=Gonapodya prolifera (strain JEL478) TaxID=1344416 RepID=A0A139AWV2_GONPJ|nr:hypothetical protein M427DRAFT_310636 [Gonapodya prolifera JEL478]|eukprot:KXS21063.1 hypothetical protein M427DRAFT_310636 [Gonapodya prolifera JEL478]
MVAQAADLALILGYPLGVPDGSHERASCSTVKSFDGPSDSPSLLTKVGRWFLRRERRAKRREISAALEIMIGSTALVSLSGFYAVVFGYPFSLARMRSRTNFAPSHVGASISAILFGTAMAHHPKQGDSLLSFDPQLDATLDSTSLGLAILFHAALSVTSQLSEWGIRRAFDALARKLPPARIVEQGVEMESSEHSAVTSVSLPPLVNSVAVAAEPPVFDFVRVESPRVEADDESTIAQSNGRTLDVRFAPRPRVSPQVQRLIPTSRQSQSLGAEESRRLGRSPVGGNAVSAAASAVSPPSNPIEPATLRITPVSTQNITPRMTISVTTLQSLPPAEFTATESRFRERSVSFHSRRPSMAIVVENTENGISRRRTQWKKVEIGSAHKWPSLLEWTRTLSIRSLGYLMVLYPIHRTTHLIVAGRVQSPRGVLFVLLEGFERLLFSNEAESEILSGLIAWTALTTVRDYFKSYALERFGTTSVYHPGTAMEVLSHFLYTNESPDFELVSYRLSEPSTKHQKPRLFRTLGSVQADLANKLVASLVADVFTAPLQAFCAQAFLYSAQQTGVVLGLRPFQSSTLFLWVAEASVIWIVVEGVRLSSKVIQILL